MTLVLAFGNPLRGDDGVGPEVGRRVAATGAVVEVVTPLQLLPEHAAQVAAADRVIFVDAAVGRQAGEVVTIALQAAPTVRVDHALTPAAILTLARDLYDARPPAWIVQVHAAHFTTGAPLSAAVAAAIPRAINAVLALLPQPHHTPPR
ncbi:MAG: hydrogenase maturation protease [Acidobacteria bacterium]|nr:hydrogenase maturation protease [Acidobacteriota bacterium]